MPLGQLLGARREALHGGVCVHRVRRSVDRQYEAKSSHPRQESRRRRSHAHYSSPSSAASKVETSCASASRLIDDVEARGLNIIRCEGSQRSREGSQAGKGVDVKWAPQIASSVACCNINKKSP